MVELWKRAVEALDVYLFQEYNIRDSNVLDVGSEGTISLALKGIAEARGCKYIGLDIALNPIYKNTDILVEPYNWGIQDETFDVVMACQTFEHIEYFWLVMKEMARILKKGGYIGIVAPGGGPVHKNATATFDGWRFYKDSMQALAKWCGVILLFSGVDPRSKPWSNCIGVFQK